MGNKLAVASCVESSWPHFRISKVMALFSAASGLFFGTSASAQDAFGPTLRLEGVRVVSAGGESSGPTLSLDTVRIEPWSGSVSGPTLELEVGQRAAGEVPEPDAGICIMAAIGLMSLLANRQCRARLGLRVFLKRAVRARIFP